MIFLNIQAIIVIIIIFSSIYLSIRYKFYSLLNIKKSFSLLRSHEGEGDISVVEALSTSLAATLGTGNIVGVGSAIALGGANSIFWMILASILGSILQFCEGALTHKYRIKNKDSFIGGPMIYIENGLKSRYNKNFKSISIIYSLILIIASLVIGNMIQASTIYESIPINKYIISIILSFFVFLVIFGGIKKIGLFCSKVIPLITFIYIFASLIIIILNIDNLFYAISLIFSDLFNFKAISGGIIGTSIKYGITRGIFTNEAGLGSGAISYANSKNRFAYQTGLVASLGVIIDTVVMCSLTAIVILISDVDISSPNQITKDVFINELGFLGGGIIDSCLLLYGFATIIGWYYFGEMAFSYCFNNQKIFKYIYLLMILIASFISNNILWEIIDYVNFGLALINISTILLLVPVIDKIIKNKE